MPEIEGCAGWRLFGVPILFHWSFPLLGLGIGLFIGSQFYGTSPILALLGFISTSASFIALVVAHELGHALAAALFSMEVNAIVIANVGGMCYMSAFPSARAALIVSASGILAQLALFALTLGLLAIFGAPTSLPLKCAVIVFTGINVVIMVLNLLPYGARDGALMIQAARAMWAGR